MKKTALTLLFCYHFSCFSQSNTVAQKNSLPNGNPIEIKLAPPNTFQLVVPTSKYLDLYSTIITDSMLLVIANNRLNNTDNTLKLDKGMKIVILSQDKVSSGIRVPKIEVAK